MHFLMDEMVQVFSQSTASTVPSHRNGVSHGDGASVRPAQHPPVHGPLAAQHWTGGRSLHEEPIQGCAFHRQLPCYLNRGRPSPDWDGVGQLGGDTSGAVQPLEHNLKGGWAAACVGWCVHSMYMVVTFCSAVHTVCTDYGEALFTCVWWSCVKRVTAWLYTDMDNIFCARMCMYVCKYMPSVMIWLLWYILDLSVLS